MSACGRMAIQGSSIYVRCKLSACISSVRRDTRRVRPFFHERRLCCAKQSANDFLRIRSGDIHDALKGTALHRLDGIRTAC